MTTKIKTTVTLKFSFTADNESCAIKNLLSWMRDYQDSEPMVTRDCESKEYTITENGTISNSFKFGNVAELAQKYGTHFNEYDLTRALLEHGNRESVTAESEIIEVEDN